MEGRDLSSRQTQYVVKELGLSFLFISHDIATVKYLAHRIAVMYLGVIVEEADSASLFAAPRHPYTRAPVFGSCTRPRFSS